MTTEKFFAYGSKSSISVVITIALLRSIRAALHEEVKALGV